MSRGSALARWLLLLALGWVACWLLPGLAVGDPAVLLRPGPPEGLRVVYLVSLYAWLLGATSWCWRRTDPPGPAGLERVGAAHWLALGFGLGLAGFAFHRGALAAAGDWSPQAPGAGAWLAALAVAPLLAFAEEFVFRGYLFSALREAWGRVPAYLASGAFFAAVHLFRPGDAAYRGALFVGLFLAALVLCRLTEATGSLWPAIGLHTLWILQGILDPPGSVVPGWWSGLRGDTVAGALGWAVLAPMFSLAGRLVRTDGEGTASAPQGPASVSGSAFRSQGSSAWSASK